MLAAIAPMPPLPFYYSLPLHLPIHHHRKRRSHRRPDTESLSHSTLLYSTPARHVTNSLLLLARSPMHHPHAMHCVPSTTTAATVCKDMTTMSETKTNDKMQKTKNTSERVCERASACRSRLQLSRREHAHACGSHAQARRERARGRPSPQHCCSIDRHCARQQLAPSSTSCRLQQQRLAWRTDLPRSLAASMRYITISEKTVLGFRWSGVGAARRGRARVQGQRAGSLEAFFSSTGVVSRAFIWVSRSARS